LEWLDQPISKEIINLMETKWMMSIGIKLVKIVSQKILKYMRKETSFHLKMEHDTKDNGKKMYVTEKELRYGLMVPDTKECGRTTKLMDRVLSGMYTEINMKESGNVIRPTVTENIPIAMELLMKVTGRTIFSMAKVLNSGTITPNMKDSIKEVKSMDKEPILGKMAHSILENGMRIGFTAVENTPGMTAESMKVNGKIIIWTAMVSILGRMAVNTKASIRKIKNMEKESIPGPMAGGMTENGKMEGNMAVENIYLN